MLAPGPAHHEPHGQRWKIRGLTLGLNIVDAETLACYLPVNSGDIAGGGSRMVQCLVSGVGQVSRRGELVICVIMGVCVRGLDLCVRGCACWDC